MNIKEQFDLIANEYDANRRKFIPCFDDFYENTTRLVLSNFTAPKRVLDLGAGTGLLTYYWYQECQTAEYVLTDISDEMLEVSRRRFSGVENVRHMVMDYTKELPDNDFDAVISALSIHHLYDAQKAELFDRIYSMLPEGGIFVNYDQFCAGTPQLNKWFDTYWERQLSDSTLSDRDIELWKERRKLDKECTAQNEIEMLRKSGFDEVSCLYSYHKFSVIAAVK